MLKDTMCPVAHNGQLFFYLKTKEQCKPLPDTTVVNVRSAMSFYSDIVSNAGLPAGFLHGNGQAMVQYSANGEASDWMFAKHGIYSMSPELGTSNKNSEKFFVASHADLKDILYQNYRWIRYTILKLQPHFDVDIINIYEPRRIFMNQTNTILSLRLNEKELNFNDRKYGSVSQKGPHENKDHSSGAADQSPITCHSLLIQVPSGGSKKGDSSHFEIS